MPPHYNIPLPLRQQHSYPHPSGWGMRMLSLVNGELHGFRSSVKHGGRCCDRCTNSYSLARVALKLLCNPGPWRLPATSLPMRCQAICTGSIDRRRRTAARRSGWQRRRRWFRRSPSPHPTRVLARFREAGASGIPELAPGPNAEGVAMEGPPPSILPRAFREQDPMAEP
jgi:hypothetical protein